MTEFTQVISDRDYQKAITKHYFAYKYTYISPILGLIVLLVTLYLTLTLPHKLSQSPIILFVLGAFLLLRPVFYIRNVFQSIKSNKLSSKETKIQLTDDHKIITNSKGNISSLNMADLHSYNEADPFLLLYASRNQFLVLDKRQMKEGNIERLRSVLEVLGIKER